MREGIDVDEARVGRGEKGWQVEALVGWLVSRLPVVEPDMTGGWLRWAG